MVGEIGGFLAARSADRPSLPFRLHPYSPGWRSPPTNRRSRATTPARPAPRRLARLLNPGIERGTAGMGSGTGIKPPPDNSFDRRSDFSAAHRARKSTQEKGFDERPQSGYAAKGPLLSPDLSRPQGAAVDINAE